MRTLHARAERPENAIRLAEFTAADWPRDLAKVWPYPRRSTLFAADADIHPKGGDV
jgi:hypothetical protein